MISINQDIVIDGKPVKIISGAIHYFRVVPEYWKDRLIKLKNMGCNTVETYIPWNIHEPYNGQYDFEGINDVEKFIELATELDLYVILRPSPYICAEWEFGGLPYWLLKESNIRSRTSNSTYLQYVERFFAVLIPKLVKHQITKGGNVILFQVENEYGYFGDDQHYLTSLMKMLIDNGVDVPLVTSDGPWGDALKCGNLELQGVLPTLNFGSKAEEHHKAFKLQYPNKPFFCMEFWIGWFDAVGQAHHERSPEECGDELRAILERGHVNIYVFHGGTNFGLMNGANYDKKLLPLVTSYDYDALLTENGTETDKYYQFQKIINEFNPIKDQIKLEPISCVAYQPVERIGCYDAFSNLNHISKCIESQYPLTFEQLDHPFGYVYYQSSVATTDELKVSINKGADRVIYYQNNNTKVATLFDDEVTQTIEFSAHQSEQQIGVLVENCGRLNFGYNLDFQQKGITHSLIVNNHIHTNFKHYCLDFHNLEGLEVKSEGVQTPTISHFKLNVKQCADTYVDVSQFGRGLLILNGTIIGRFDITGPQTRIYIPGPLLNPGQNDIHIFETEGIVSDKLSFDTCQKWSKVSSHQAVEN